MASVLARRASTPSRIEARQHHPGQQRARGARRKRARPNKSAAPRRGRRSAKEFGRAKWSCGLPARRVFRRASPRRPASNRCRPAFCSAPRSGSGCRHNRRSPPSAWWPGRSAPRRDRPAGSGKIPAEKPEATARAKTTPRAHARRGRNPEEQSAPFPAEDERYRACSWSCLPYRENARTIEKSSAQGKPAGAP